MGRKARICIIVMFISVILMPLESCKAESCPYESITIQIAQPRQIAFVAPGQDGIVRFTGTVFAQIPWTPEMDALEVDLQPEAGNFAVTSPSSMIFTRAQKQQSFEIFVHIPTGTSSSVQGQLSVHGRWKALNTTSSGSIPPATAIIVVKQFTLIDMDGEEGFISIEQGDWIRTFIEVHNRGNSIDQIRSEIHNIEELKEKGWDISFDPDKLEIEEGGASRVDLTMSSSFRVKPNIYEVEFVSISARDAGLDIPTFNYTLFIEVKEKELMGVPYKIWFITEGALIIVLGIVVSCVVLKKRRSRKIPHSKLSRTRE